MLSLLLSIALFQGLGMLYSAHYTKNSGQSIPIKASFVNTSSYTGPLTMSWSLSWRIATAVISWGNVTAAPYINHLANSFGVASAYYDLGYSRSLPNYLGVTTAETYSSWSGCNKPPQQCSGFIPITLPTIVDSIEKSGLTWKAYTEDMPGNCY